jgi:hypothetical protein
MDHGRRRFQYLSLLACALLRDRLFEDTTVENVTLCLLIKI